ncbi:MAG TPA: FkbM family methyltransferase, partial [Rhizomicrobium sp.]
YSGIETRRYDFKDKVRTIEIEAITIDALLAPQTERRWRICKLDLEGGELRALQGGVAALNRFRPLVVFENDQENSARDYGYSRDEWFGFFEAGGYEVFDLWGRAYGRNDWGRRDIPWYFIAASANSAETDFLAGRLPGLLSKYLER